MHPEIRQPGPGKCPICGMALRPEHEVHSMTQMADDRGLGLKTWRNYIPLIVIIGLIFLSTLALSWRDSRAGEFGTAGALIYFMTGFFLVFGGFKLLDLKGFAEGYETYDLLAMRTPAYAYAYPFIELTFGLLMLGGIHAPWLLWTEFAVMAFSGLGVLIKIWKRETIQCVCLGTTLKVPLTTVTLIEDFGMAALALAVLFLS
jgi:hypothetical protein